MIECAGQIGLEPTRPTSEVRMLSTSDRERILARFWPKVDKNGPIHPVLGTECWLWTGPLQSNGYAKFSALGEQWAHRASYALLVGPIPAGLVIDHLCRNPICVRPNHLESVTQSVNTLRGFSPTAITHRTGICRKGHDLSTVGVYVNPGNSWYGAQCRACARDRQAERRATKRSPA